MLIKDLAALNKNEEDDTPYRKKLKFYSRIPLLILDEWLTVSRTVIVIIQELIDNRWEQNFHYFLFSTSRGKLDVRLQEYSFRRSNY